MNQKILRLAITYCATFACLYWWPVFCHVFSILSTPCLNASAAAWISGQQVRSLEDCFWRTRQSAVDLQSIGLVQFDRRYLSCTLFRYRDVCHLLNLTALAASNRQQVMVEQQCESLVDSEYNVLTANAHFAAVWIGGHGPALENIVCGLSGPRNPVWASGVAWTPDGARMDGANSGMLVNDSTGFDFSQAFTMVMEFKRSPGVYALMELTDCSTFSTMLSHFWEHPATCQLYVNPVNFYLARTIQRLLSNDSSEFIKVAVAQDMTANRTKMFFGSAALPDSAIEIVPSVSTGVVRSNCVKIGYRSSGYGTLNGTVKMAAIANSYLPEDVVLRFMSGN